MRCSLLSMSIALVMVLALAANIATATKRDHAWPSWGGDLSNSRNFAGASSAITANTVHNLKVHRFIDAKSGVPATPTTMGDNAVYFVDSASKLHCNDRNNGQSIWTFDISAFLTAQGATGNAFVAQASRCSPTLTDNHVYISTLAGSYVIKLDRFKGKLIWAKQITAHPFAKLTASPRVYRNQVLIGTSSSEESASSFIPGYVNTFIGEFVSLDSADGSIQWRTPFQPSGYAGAAIWSNDPPIDEKRHQVIVTSGNSYNIPESVQTCVDNNGNVATAVYPDPCREAGDLSESIVALDLATGNVNWKVNHSPVEAYILACGLNAPGLGVVFPRITTACPQVANPSPDTDFAQAPIFVHGEEGVTPGGKDALFVGQKSGIVWAVAAEDGAVLWTSAPGPGGAAGGVMWGSATNGTHMFYANTASQVEPYQLENGNMTSLPHIGALSLLTGEIVWQRTMTTIPVGALTHSGGLVFAPCMLPAQAGGVMQVLDASSGEIVFTKTDMPGRMGGATASIGNKLYIASGYTADPAGGVFIMGL